MISRAAPGVSSVAIIVGVVGSETSICFFIAFIIIGIKLFKIDQGFKNMYLALILKKNYFLLNQKHAVLLEHVI